MGENLEMGLLQFCLNDVYKDVGLLEWLHLPTILNSEVSQFVYCLSFFHNADSFLF